ncbi:MAG: uracil-DNA glycosylase [Actinobacteria bacterium]|nr:uracil-DNA glycosylase [Actinomycetota bacterium]
MRKAWLARRRFDLNPEVELCRLCPRLVQWREQVGREKRAAFRDEEYWSRPLPSFGPADGRLLVVGLAPAAHGGNRTGRIFTGDRSGDWLFRALYRAGFANQPTSARRGDGLRLDDCLVTASARCAPPDNKPTAIELENCSRWLIPEMRVRRTVVVALGGLAFAQVLRLGERIGWTVSRPRPRFGHGREFDLDPGPIVIASYHPSQQNTFTGRLTEPMLDDIFGRARELISSG